MAEVQFGSDLIPIQDTFPFDSNDMGMFIALAPILTFSLEIFDLFQLPPVEEGLAAMTGMQQHSSLTSDPWLDEMIVDGHIVSPGSFALNIQLNNEVFETTTSIQHGQEHGDSHPEPVRNPSSHYKPIRPFNSEASNTLLSAKPKKRYPQYLSTV